jgi:hypothetical protein
MCVLRLEGRGRVERSVRAIKAPPESLPTTDYRSTSGTPINGRPPASPEHPGRKLITNQIQIRSKLRWPLQTITWSRGRLASVITWPFREPHPCRRSCRSSSNWIRAMCARGRSGWSLRALRWRAIGLRRDERRTIRPRQRRRLPDTPPLRSWRRGSIGEQVDVEAALVGLHLDETSSVSRSHRRAHRSSQYECAGCAQQNAVIRRPQVWRRDTPGCDAGHLNLPVDVRFFANDCREGFAGLGGLPDLV